MWNVFEGTDLEWDKLVRTLPRGSYYQSSAWANYKKSLGQVFLRVIKQVSGKAVLFQAFIKKTPFGGCILWVPGGMVGDFDLVDSSLIKFLEKSLSTSFVLLRVSFLCERTDEDFRLLVKSSGKFALKGMGSGKSLEMNLELSPDILKKQMRQNWRHNLKRFQKKNYQITLWENPDFRIIHGLYQKLERFKKISQQYTEAEMLNMQNLLSQSLSVYKIEDANKNILALRAFVSFGERAWDFLAVTTEAGRKDYCSFGLFWGIITECQKLGIKRYDLMGIDSKNNPGVSDFKKGTGAQVLDYLGEWEWSSSVIIRYFFNFLLWVRR